MEKVNQVNLCKGGCGNKAVYKGWCGIKWKKGNKVCITCPKIEEKRAKAISKYRLKEASLGLNPMQNPEICKKNHSIKRNEKASKTFKRLGKLGLLPQQTESKKLREKRRKNICNVLKRLAKEGKLNHQIESVKKKRERHKKISDTLKRLAKQHKLKLQNLTHKEKEMFSRKISKALKKAIAEGRIKPNLGGFRTPYKMKYGDKVILRSSWEAEVAKLLDNLDLKWEYEPFYVKYFNTEKKLMSNTLPDFYLPKYNLIIEVKGASIALKKTKDKIRWLKKTGYNVLLIGRKEIKLIRNNEINPILKKIYNEGEKLCQRLN
jgi:hypothetical protein